jgi:hypothetical protein
MFQKVHEGDIYVVGFPRGGTQMVLMRKDPLRSLQIPLRPPSVLSIGDGWKGQVDPRHFMDTTVRAVNLVLLASNLQLQYCCYCRLESFTWLEKVYLDKNDNLFSMPRADCRELLVESNRDAYYATELLLNKKPLDGKYDTIGAAFSVTKVIN